MQPDSPVPQPTATPPQEPIPQPVAPPRQGQHRGRLLSIWLVITLAVAGVAAFAAYSTQLARIHTLNSKIADLETALATKQQEEKHAQSDDQAVETAAKNFCEGQLSADSKLPRKFTGVDTDGTRVHFGGEKKFAQIKVDCRDVSNTDPLAPVTYTLKKTNDVWYVIHSDPKENKATTTLFGIPSNFND